MHTFITRDAAGNNVTVTPALQSFSDICAYAAQAMEGISRDEIARQVAISGTCANLAKRMFDVYARAEKGAAKHGYIGVGVITYAEWRLAQYQARLAYRDIAL